MIYDAKVSVIKSWYIRKVTVFLYVVSPSAYLPNTMVETRLTPSPCFKPDVMNELPFNANPTISCQYVK